MANNENLKKARGFDVNPQNINRKGPPRKLPQLDVLLAEVLGEEKEGITAAQVILMALRKKATAGDVRAAEVLLNRAFGAVKQSVDLNIEKVIFKAIDLDVSDDNGAE